MSIVLLGIDLAKNVFALHGLNEAGRVGLTSPAGKHCTEATAYS